MEQCSVAEACRGRCEVAVQWEEPEDRLRDVGVQSDTQWCDVAVQVDLIGFSGRSPGSGDVPWRCLSMRPEQPEGGALWHCCVHGQLAPPPSAALLRPSPCRTPELQTTLPSVHHSSPSRQTPPAALQSSPALNLSGLSLPSMPSCGNSPSSHHQGASDTDAEAPSAAPGPGAPEVQAPVGLMAPLSSDEDTQTSGPGLGSSADASIKKRRGRPKNAKSRPSPSDPETPTNQERRRKTERAARLPLRYLLDYDLESHDLLPANKTPPENAEGAGPGAKDEPTSDKKVPLQPPKLEEFESAAKEKDADDWPNNASIISHPAVEPVMPRPLSPGEVLKLNVVNTPPVLPLKQKKVKKSQPPAFPKTPGWPIEDETIKDEPTDDENTDLEGSDCPKAKIKRIKVKKEASDLFKKIGIKEEDEIDDFLNHKMLKDGILGIKKNKKPVNSDVVKADANENDAPPTGLKRKAGKPKKTAKLDDEIKEEELQFKEENGKVALGLAEQTDRPRRATVGPPLRYLLESEERGAGKRARPFSDDEYEAQTPRSEKLKLGDVVNGDAGKAGMVKKVKILNAESAERRSWINSLESVAQIKYEDVEDIYVLPKDATGVKVEEDREAAVEERRKRGRRKKPRQDTKMDLSRTVLSAFLVFKDGDTSAVTLIPPCSVKLQKLSNKQDEQMNQSQQV